MVHFFTGNQDRSILLKIFLNSQRPWLVSFRSVPVSLAHRVAHYHHQKMPPEMFNASED